MADGLVKISGGKVLICGGGVATKDSCCREAGAPCNQCTTYGNYTPLRIRVTFAGITKCCVTGGIPYSVTMDPNQTFVVEQVGGVPCIWRYIGPIDDRWFTSWSGFDACVTPLPPWNLDSSRTLIELVRTVSNTWLLTYESVPGSRSAVLFWCEINTGAGDCRDSHLGEANWNIDCTGYPKPVGYGGTLDLVPL
jgi:hypothetical protein